MEYFSSKGTDSKSKTYQKDAHYELRSDGRHGSVQLKYNIEHGYLWIMHSRETLTRIEKCYEIAKKLNAKLFRNRTVIDKSQMEKIRQKYRERLRGTKAPKD